MVLHGNYFVIGCADFLKQFLVEWFHKTKIIMGGIKPFLGEQVTSFDSKVSRMTNCKNCHFFSTPKFPALPYFQLFQWSFPINHDPISPGVSDRERTIMQRSGKHKVAKFLLVHRSRNHHIGNASEISKIKYAVMGGTISSCKASAIKTKNYMQILKSHIMHYLIIGTLHKRGVDVTKWDKPLCC